MDLFDELIEIDQDYTSGCIKYRGKKGGVHTARLRACMEHYNKKLEPFDIYKYKHCRSIRCVNPTHFGIIQRAEVELTEYHGDVINLNALDDAPRIREGYLRAPFGYPGSKAKSLEHILPELPYRNLYCEPFGGSAAVLLARNKSKLEIYNDRFGGITCFYRVLRNAEQLAALMERLELTLHSREEFVWCRDTWKSINDDDIERAARWFYMHTYSFANLGRNFGRSLDPKSLFAPKLKGAMDRFYPCHVRLKNVQIENLDWRTCLQDYDTHDTVFYIDPPYLCDTKGIYRHEMTAEEHIELCERIFKLKGFAALSGYGDKETRELYGSFPWTKVKEWSSTTTMLAQAFSDTNNLGGKIMDRSNAITNEMLFIKESSDE